jgi:hypothetical protein
VGAHRRRRRRRIARRVGGPHPWAAPVVCPCRILFKMTLFDGNYFTECRFPLVSWCAKCTIAPYIFENCSRGKRNALRGWNCSFGAAGVRLFQLAGNGPPGRRRRHWRGRQWGSPRWSRRGGPAARRRSDGCAPRCGRLVQQREPRQWPRVQLLGPVQEQVLRRGVLLQQRLSGHLRNLFASDVARHVHHGRRRRQAERSE